MLTIRLQRIGRKNEAAFRVVVTDSKHAAKSGKFHEIVGSYTLKSDEVKLDKERITHWMNHGAQVSDTVHNMLVKQGVIKEKKKNVLSKKAPTVKRKELKKK
ncbi:MAG TPA: 30S ribosomal protein S16 [Candidatus Paceibacterota bacterium]|nr:30S ribosomal protein S16 [Candidatus Paceibacterota bacterium]